MSTSSVTRPVPHTDQLFIPLPTTSAVPPWPSSESQSSEEEYQPSAGYGEASQPELLSQCQLTNLVRELNLTKEDSELLGSTPKSKNVLVPATVFSRYSHRKKELVLHFSEEGLLVYCAISLQL